MAKDDFILQTIQAAEETTKNPWIALANMGLATFTVQGLPAKPGQEWFLPLLIVLALIYTASLFLPQDTAKQAVRRVPGGIVLATACVMSYFAVFVLAAIVNLIFMANGLLDILGQPEGGRNLSVPFLVTALMYALVYLNKAVGQSGRKPKPTFKNK